MIFAAFPYLTNNKKKGWLFARLITEEGSCLGKSVLGTLSFPLIPYYYKRVSDSRSNVIAPIPAFFGADTASYSRG